jgi:hypothetical protein
MSAERDLFRKLARELFQTETSAVVHGRREASRLAGTPVASALLQIAAHAEASLATLPPSFRQDMTLKLGEPVGKLFSNVRQLFVDRMIDRERSFRGTLLGCRHGIDLVRLLQPLAVRLGEASLAEWCTNWLETRERLVEQATRQLTWFASHAEEAVQSGTRPLIPRTQ